MMKRPVFIAAALALLLALALWAAWLAAIPAFFDKAEAMARSRAASALNKAAREALESVGGGNFADSRQVGGAVILKSGAAEYGALAAMAAERAQTLFEQESELNVSLYAFELLPARFSAKLGPKLTMRFDMSGAASAGCGWRFSSAGVNQSVHTLTLEMSLSVSVSAAGKSRSVEARAQYPAAQTVIIGAVPQSYYSGGRLSLVP